MVRPYLNEVGGKVENDVNLFTGGLNTYEDKAFLESNQMPYVMNLTMSKPPAMRTRNMRQTLAPFFENHKIPWNSGEIVNMWAYNQKYIYFIRKIDDTTFKLCLVTRGSTNEYYELHTFYSNLHVEGAQFCYCRTEVNEYVYFGNEVYKCRVTLGSDNPLDFEEYQDHFGIPVWHKSRLWLLRPTQGKVEWSNAFMPDDFTIGYDPQTQITGDSGEHYISSTRGNITGAISFDDKLMIFCEHSMHAIYGSSGEEGDSEYFTVVDILGTLGCLKNEYLTISGGRIYWYGDDRQVYEYSGASVNIISRPGKSRNSTLSVGGVDNVLNTMNVTKLVASSDKLYIDTKEGYMFVFDAFNRVWWCEDGGFATICNYSQSEDNLLMATHEGDIQTYDFWGENASLGFDNVYDWETQAETAKNINYEFHTRVYGADGVDLRKTISDVWVQCNTVSGNGSVYLNDNWCIEDVWKDDSEIYESRYKKIGTYHTNSGGSSIDKYANQAYEQRRFIVEKMYGQRLNTFQIIVKGTRDVEFFLMKREWRAR